jgi:ABC-2 type transport system ATP-binding protein
MGHDLAADRMAALAEVGYLPGELGLARELTGRRTLDALARLHPRPPARQVELLRRFELSDRDLGRRVREYSRGMKQKLGLVAALQHDPPLAILDEPTAGLDPVMQARLLEWLADRARDGRTVLFSSHVLGEVEDLCDRVAMVRGGRLLLVRTVDELRRARVRRAEVTFREPVDPSRYATDGVGPVEVSGRIHRFALRGDPAPLLAALGALPVADLTVEAPSLEDVFLAEYEAQAPAAA